MAQVNQGILPNLPYAQPDGVVFAAWQGGHWGSWAFTSNSSLYDAVTGTFVFNRGGFQESRGGSASSTCLCVHREPRVCVHREPRALVCMCLCVWCVSACVCMWMRVSACRCV
jgi:hypothetical protein